MFEKFQVAIGGLIAALGLSISYKWFLSPSPSSIPFIGLVILILGLAMIGSGVRSMLRKSKKKSISISPTTVIAGGIGAAIAIAGIKALIDEMNKKASENRAEAIIKLKQLEDEYNRVKHQLTEDQRRFFENVIQDYKRKLGVS